MGRRLVACSDFDSFWIPDFVEGACNDIVNGVTAIWKASLKKVRDTANAATSTANWLRNQAKTVKYWSDKALSEAKAATRAVQNEAEKAARGVKTAAEAVAKEAETALQTVKNEAEKAANSVTGIFNDLGASIKCAPPLQHNGSFANASAPLWYPCMRSVLT